jgi:hypothetical protein
MSRPLSVPEQHTFGVDAKVHLITGIPVEQGSGALPPHQQALLHCRIIEQHEGKARADELRKLIADAMKFEAAQRDMAAAKATLAADGMTPAQALTS